MGLEVDVGDSVFVGLKEGIGVGKLLGASEGN